MAVGDDCILLPCMRRLELTELSLGVLKAMHAISGRLIADTKGQVSPTQSPVPLQLLTASKPACICGTLLHGIATVLFAAACCTAPMCYSPRTLISTMWCTL